MQQHTAPLHTVAQHTTAQHAAAHSTAAHISTQQNGTRPHTGYSMRQHTAALGFMTRITRPLTPFPVTRQLQALGD